MIKDLFAFEFLGVPEKKPLLEKDLEYKLIKHIENFLLELGKGFMLLVHNKELQLEMFIIMWTWFSTIKF
mgnify:FL=1